MSQRKDEEAQFYQKISQRSTNASLTLATASGDVLGNCEIEPIKKLLDKWNKLPKSERKPGAIQVPDLKERDPNSLPGVNNPPPPGALVLKVFLRPLKRDSKGKLTREALSKTGYGWTSRDTGREGFWVLEPELKTLVPKDAKKGDTYPLPASLRDRIVRFHLADFYRNARPWMAKDVRTADLTLTVEEASDTMVRLRLQGRVVIEANAKTAQKTNGYDGHLLGYLDYDRSKKAFTRFDVVAVGDARWYDPTGYVNIDKTLGHLTVGMAFEIAPAGTGFALLVPRYLGDGGERGYKGAMQEYLATNMDK
jgi:hypothetical protein